MRLSICCFSIISVDVESKLASAREELTPNNNTMGMLRAKMKICLDRMDCDQWHASCQCFLAAEERLKADFDHRCDLFVWEMRVKNLGAKLSVSVDAETRPHELNFDFAVRVAGKDSRWLRMTDARACVVVFTKNLGKRIEGVVVQTGDTTDKLQLDLATSLWTGSSFNC